MQYGLTKIISSSIENLGRIQDDVYDTNLYAMRLMATHLIDGVQKMEELWPDLSKEEKQELKATVEFLKTTYLISDEEIMNRTLKKQDI